jgi:tRNA 2-thiouridine synthesizing protein C
MKKILFVLRKAPYEGAYNEEILDMAMTAAAFEQAVSIMLLDDAVMHLAPNQTTTFPGIKSLNGVFKAFPLYDIETVFVERDSLDFYGLDPTNLIGTPMCLHSNEIAATLRQFDIVLCG